VITGLPVFAIDSIFRESIGTLENSPCVFLYLPALNFSIRYFRCPRAKFLYLFFGFHDPMLAVLTIGLFAPLIAFHFAANSLSARTNNIIRIKSMLKKQNA
jgi:hypothetical protein